MNRWPVILFVGMAVVVAVNLGFIWVAVATAPDIDPSYSGTQER
jgi:hypothetical protein